MSRRITDLSFFFFQAEDGIRDYKVTGVQTCALPISTGIELINHWWVLVLLYPTLTVPFCTWIMIGYFGSIPKELDEAALIDGAGYLRSEERRVGKECRSRWSPYH